MDLGSVPAFSLRTLASTTNITASGGSVLELSASTPTEARVMEFWNTTGATVNIYTGPDANLDLFCIAPGMSTQAVKCDRGPVTLSAGTRLSVRAAANTAISAGELIINFWR